MLGKKLTILVLLKTLEIFKVKVYNKIFVQSILNSNYVGGRLLCDL